MEFGKVAHRLITKRILDVVVVSTAPSVSYINYFRTFPSSNTATNGAATRCSHANSDTYLAI